MSYEAESAMAVFSGPHVLRCACTSRVLFVQDVRIEKTIGQPMSKRQSITVTIECDNCGTTYVLRSLY